MAYTHSLSLLNGCQYQSLILVQIIKRQLVNVQVVTHDKQGLFREIDVDKRGKISLQQ